MYYLPSSSSGKPHVVALDKEVGALLGWILISIIVIIMVMIRRSRRMHDYSDYYSDYSEYSGARRPSCYCFIIFEKTSQTHVFSEVVSTKSSQAHGFCTFDFNVIFMLSE